MKQLKFVKAFTLALASLAAPFAASATTMSEGSIYEIRVVDQPGVKTFGERNAKIADGTLCSAENPLVAGETVYIRVRTLVSNWVDCWKLSADTKPWQFAGSSSMTTYKPALGIYIGDRLDWAEYVEQTDKYYQQSGPLMYTGEYGEVPTPATKYSYYHDFYFSYTVKAGDIGLPIQLANKSGQKAGATDAGEYALRYVNYGYAYWTLSDGAGTEINWQYGAYPPSPSTPEWPEGNGKVGETDGPQRSPNLVSEGAFVKTIDFDTEEASEGIWRTVYPGMTQTPTGQSKPKLKLAGGAISEEKAVYIWSDNESVVLPVADSSTAGKSISTIGGKQVLTITLATGEDSFTFTLKGADGATAGQTAKIYMSSSQSATYLPSGDLLTNAVQRTVQVVEAPAPTVRMYLDGGYEKTVTAEPDKTVLKGELTFELVPTCDYDVTVDLAATIDGGRSLTALYTDNLLRIAESEGFDIDGKPTTVKIPKNTSKVTRYIYVLGASEDSEKGIKFVPSLASGTPSEVSIDAKASIFTIMRGGSDNPIAVTAANPAKGATITVANGETKTLTYKIVDTYRNNKSADGYQYVMEDDDSLEQLATATLKPDSNGKITWSLKFDMSFNNRAVTVYAVSPDGVTQTEPVHYNIVVTPGKAAQIEPWDTTSTRTVGEGETFQLKLSLNQAHTGGNRFIFVKGATAADEALFSSKLTELGALVSLTDYKNVETPQKVQFLDGEDGGTAVTLNDFLGNTQTDPTDKVAGWAEGTLTVTVTNKAPTFKSLNFNGAYLTPEDNGKALTDPVSANVDKIFTLVADDVTADLDATGDKAMWWKWSIDGVEYERRGNPYGQTVTNKFKTVKNGAKIYLWMADKDMLDGQGKPIYPTTPQFQFSVNVTTQPTVVIEPSSTAMNESDTLQHQIKLSLTEAPSAEVKVRFTVQQTTTGFLKIRTVTGSIEEATDDTGKVIEGAYDVTFPANDKGPKTLVISEMDGTVDTETGVTLNAEVTTTTTTSDGMEWKDFYTKADPVTISVKNDDPKITRPRTDNVTVTNGYNICQTYNVSVNTRYTLEFQASDILADIQAGWEDAQKHSQTGLVVTVTGSDLADFTTNVTDSSTKYPIPVEFNTPGKEYFVTITVTDKDGGETDCTILYKVNTANILTLSAHGPAVASATHTQSARYGAASGLGAGRVWAGDAGPNKVSEFVHLYTVDGSQDVTARAYGYSADGKPDDGKLATSHDQSIDKDGNWSKSSSISEYYNYTTMHEAGKLGLDSFVYGWVQPETEDGTSAFLYNIGKEGSASIALTTNKYYEAVFSREYYAADNCGDINRDKIPDAVVYKYGMGVIDTSTGTASSSTETSGQPGSGSQTTTTTTGDDLADLSDYNEDLDKDGGEDPDYLPITDTAAYAELIPGLKGTWLTQGKEFTALMETRGASSLGAGDGLNDALSQLGIVGTEPERIYAEKDGEEWKWTSNCTISELEYFAWTEYAAAAGVDFSDGEAVTNSWQEWSPERATSPILSDTDGDGFSDGYEYYFWYQAHVGYFDTKGNHKYLTGRRFDPRNPGEGVELPSRYIARLMDPRSDLDAVDEWTQKDIARTGLAISSDDVTRDTDNDGLVDLLEFEIGTNPFDFDTDHDGLADGWELMIAGLNPLLATSSSGAEIDTVRNYDGDAMAITSPAREKGVAPTPLFIQQLQSFAVVDDDGDSDGIQWYVMKPEDAETQIAFTTNAVTFWAVTVGEDTYATTVEKVYVTADGRLGTELNRDNTFTYSTNEVEVAGEKYANVLLTPTSIPMGTKVTVSAEQTEGVYVTVATAPKQGYCQTAWVYGSDIEGTADYGFLALARYGEPKKDARLAQLPSEKREVFYLHSLVYQEFGFDPRTAWTTESPIASRWTATTSDGQSVSGVYIVQQGGLVNYATRTREYCAYDEFLLHSFFVNNGVSMSGSTYVTTTGAPNWANIWGAFTTNPQGPNEPDLTTLDVSDSETADGSDYYFGRESEDGADTDGDGVPDGWELYIMAGPKLGGKFNFAPPYAGFTTSFGGSPAESFWSPFVAKANDTETTNQIYLGGQPNMDDLNELREFSGTDSCAYYAEYATSILKREEQTAGSGVYTADDSKWLNKFLPSDPWNVDTDGDGLSDSDEGKAFVYGTPVDDGEVWSVVGGGLNPCGVDTDLDGLPDGWEEQFAGTWDESAGVQDANHGIVNGMDGTVKDAVTTPGGVNRDYDHDGLDNWQEYLTGTMRCWRYDDPLSRWDAIPESAYYTTDDEGNVTFDALHAATNLLGKVKKDGSKVTADDFWYATLVDRTSGIYNPRLVTDVNPAEYMTHIKNGWDPAFYNADLVIDATTDVHAGGAFYWFCNTINGEKLISLWGGLNEMESGKVYWYASCSPISADSDQDGMDDYYELFHGLNPLLGASGVVKVEGGKPCDLIADAWAGSSGSIVISAWGNDSSRDSGVANYWLTDEGKALRKPRGSEFDFVAYPWLNGLAGADPDGDDILNQTEALMPKIANAGYHTDPTPLWMTDASYTNSITSLYFKMPTRYVTIEPGAESFVLQTIKTEGEGDEAVTTTNKTYYYFRNYPGAYGSGKKVAYMPTAPDLWKLTGATAGNWKFSFEENEGYDSDHDGFGDYAELSGKYGHETDALDADAEQRRQAIWFAGTNAVLQTMPETAELYPVGGQTYPQDPSFSTFTVECWVKPDADMLKGTHVVIERATWVNPTKAADQEYIRKNFQIALKDGHWFGKYDPEGTYTMNEVSVVDSSSATTDWSHLALTYDGATLSLYVNGAIVSKVSASLPPEHGIYAMAVSADGLSRGNLPHDQSAVYPEHANLAHTYDYVALLIGGSIKTQQEFDPSYMTLGSSNIIKAVGLALNLQLGCGWDYYTRFFKGYVDEVRVWDGARTAEQIEATRMVRFSRENALENRSAFYAQWKLGEYRYLEGVTGVVPELRYHYSFDTLPSADNAAAVAKVPDGFDSSLIALSRPEDYRIGWWEQTLSGYTGTVYSNAVWVQWIPNTVAHLPRYDGTVLDSAYWSDDFAGEVQAEGVGSWSINKSAEPVSMWTQVSRAQVKLVSEYKTTSERHWLVSAGFTNETEFALEYDFTARHLNQVGDDLIPLGGTFAKYVAQTTGLWDDNGASTSYEITGEDADLNGLPDWWEDYAKHAGGYTKEETLTWNTVVDYGGVSMTAGEAYMRDLEKGYYVDENGKIVTDSDAYAQTADDDHDGLADAWEKRQFGSRFTYDDKDDPDEDGLSNYAEYLVTEVLNLCRLDPTVAKTDGVCIDYFRKFGQFYIGEVFTDHDQVDDAWENEYATENQVGKTYASAGVYDPTRDTDGDGWSNYAEAKAGTDPTVGTSLSFGEYTLPQYPVPVIKAEILYNGSYAIDGPIVVKAWNESTDPEMTGLADAQWTIGSTSGDSTSSDDTSSSAQNDESTDTLSESVKYIGLNKALRRNLNLGPKAISQGSVKVCFLDPDYDVGAFSDGKFVKTGDGRVSDASWYCAATDDGDGEIVTSDGTSVGSIDYTTGEVTLDFTAPVLRGELIGSSENSWTGTGSSSSTNVHGTVSRLDLSRSHVLIAWEGKQIGLTGSGTYYLSDVDPVEGSGDILSSKGHVREGRNTFIAYVADSNGDFIPGKPFGVIRNVDVGWSSAAFTIELSETSAISPRLDLVGDASDRATYLSEQQLEDYDHKTLNFTNNIADNVQSVSIPEATKAQVRVVRYGVNDFYAFSCGVACKTVMDKTLDMSSRAFLCEADFIGEDQFDIDWDDLYRACTKSYGCKMATDSVNGSAVISNMTYLVVIGDGAAEFRGLDDTNTIIKAMGTRIVRRFEICRSKPVVSEPNMTLYESRPTFRWRMPNEETYAKAFGSSYTAFRVQIWSKDMKTLVYDSEYQRAPVQRQTKIGEEPEFVWTAPVCVGDLTDQGVVFENNTTYKWRVSMYNAKFKDDKWSSTDNTGWLTTAINLQPVNHQDYSSIGVSVKYTGHTNVLAFVENADMTGKVRVQAFTSPDFTGVPVASAVVQSRASLMDVADQTANATLIGLPVPGTYYIRAFIDSYGNGQKDVFESWGAAKTAVLLTTENVQPLVKELFIEDADDNDNKIPDAYEYTLGKFGWCCRWDVRKGEIPTTVLTNGTIALSSNVVAEIELASENVNYPDGLPMATLTLVQNPTLAGMICGLGGTTEGTEDWLREEMKKEIDAETVRVTSLEFDQAAGIVTLYTDAELKYVNQESAEALAEVFDAATYSTTSVKVTLKVYFKASLDDAWPTEAVKTVECVEIGNGQKSVDVKLEGIDFTSGFFKIEVVQ